MGLLLGACKDGELLLPSEGECADLTCAFDAGQSRDVDGSILTRSWDFRDGTSSGEAYPSHTYGAGGTLAVVLTVIDDQGAQGSQSQDVTVAAPPAAAAMR